MQEESFFEGGVFSEAIDGGRAGADIELTHDSVSANTRDGQWFSIRYSDCTVDFGGFNNKMTFCRNADKSVTIFTEDKKFPKSLAYAAGGLLDEQLEEKTKKLKGDRRSARYFSLGVLVVFLIGVVGLYYGVRAAGSAAVKAVPISVDKQIGTHSYASLAMGDEVNDPIVVEAMEKIVERLKPHAAIEGLDFEIKVIHSDEINAFALPGGKMVIFTGLISEADMPEQVAGVLAHEMAHATLRHGLQRISQSLGLAAAVNLLLGDVQGIVVLGSELFQLASINSYSRAQETAADVEGVRMLHEAGIDPLGLAQFFELLKEQGNDLPDGLEWISTHPDHDARIISVRETVGELGPRKYAPIDIDWEAIQMKVSEL